MYYENFEKLCKTFKVTPSQVSRETGVSTATLTSWKQGKYTPKNEKIKKITDYFNVPLYYIVNDWNDNKAEDFIVNDDEKEIILKLRKADATTVEMVKRLLCYSSLKKQD